MPGETEESKTFTKVATYFEQNSIMESVQIDLSQQYFWHNSPCPSFFKKKTKIYTQKLTMESECGQFINIKILF